MQITNQGSNRHNERGERPVQSTVDIDLEAPSRSSRRCVPVCLVASQVTHLRRRLPGLLESAIAVHILSLRRLAFLRWSGVDRSFIIGAVILVV